jgi:hypothetical protein
MMRLGEIPPERCGATKASGMLLVAKLYED